MTDRRAGALIGLSLNIHHTHHQRHVDMIPKISNVSHVLPGNTAGEMGRCQDIVKVTETMSPGDLLPRQRIEITRQ